MTTLCVVVYLEDEMWRLPNTTLETLNVSAWTSSSLLDKAYLQLSNEHDDDLETYNNSKSYRFEMINFPTTLQYLKLKFNDKPDQESSFTAHLPDDLSQLHTLILTTIQLPHGILPNINSIITIDLGDMILNILPEPCEQLKSLTLEYVSKSDSMPYDIPESYISLSDLYLNDAMINSVPELLPIEVLSLYHTGIMVPPACSSLKEMTLYDEQNLTNLSDKTTRLQILTLCEVPIKEISQNNLSEIKIQDNVSIESISTNIYAHFDTLFIHHNVSSINENLLLSTYKLKELYLSEIELNWEKINVLRNLNIDYLIIRDGCRLPNLPDNPSLRQIVLSKIKIKSSWMSNLSNRFLGTIVCGLLFKLRKIRRLMIGRIFH